MKDLGYTWEIRQDFNQSPAGGLGEDPDTRGTLPGAEGSGDGLGPYSKFDLVLKSWPSLCDPEHEF